jgi:hypothetical protein
MPNARLVVHVQGPAVGAADSDHNGHIGEWEQQCRIEGTIQAFFSCSFFCRILRIMQDARCNVIRRGY